MKNLFVKTSILLFIFCILVIFSGCKPNGLVLVENFSGEEFYISLEEVKTEEWMAEMEFLPNQMVQSTVENSLYDYFENYRINKLKAPNMNTKYNDIGRIYKDFLIKNSKFLNMYENERNKQIDLDEKKFRKNFEYNNLKDEILSLKTEIAVNNLQINAIETVLVEKNDASLIKKLKKMNKINKKIDKKLKSLENSSNNFEVEIKDINNNLEITNKNIEQLSNSQDFVDINNFLDYLLLEVKYEKGIPISINKGILEKISLLNSKFGNGNNFYLLDEAKEYEINENVSTYESIRHYMSDIITKRFMTFLSSNFTKAPISVTSIQAAMYCNQKSLSNGLELCYNITEDGYSCDYSKNGYRLPTKIELEFIIQNKICDNIGDVLYNEIEKDDQLPFLVVKSK